MAVVIWAGLLVSFVVPLLDLGTATAGWLPPLLLYRRTSGYREDALFTDDSPLVSALGDPGMKSDRVRVAVEGWNFCNRAGNLTDPNISKASSPRWADCTDLVCPPHTSAESCTAVKRVSEVDNSLATGDSFPGGGFTSYNDPDLYAIEKEKYLGALCAVDPEPSTWSFWMIMLKNGNFDESSGLCPIALESSSSSGVYNLERSHFTPSLLAKQILYRPQGKSGFPCFGPRCMNQPLVYHNWSQPQFFKRGNNLVADQEIQGLTGGFYGTYDVDEADSAGISSSSSFFSVNWYKNESGGSWNFHHVLRVSQKYPWLMLYLRADATSGLSGGYPWATRGMMYKVPQSPHFKVVFTLNVLKGGGSASQFYLLDIGGCWKNNGEQCNGDLATDVTRYSEMIINPSTDVWCSPKALDMCPPVHTTYNGTKIHRNDTQNYPYSAYHLYCSPYNALYPEKPSTVCDPYSNPQAQELLQLLPHPEWAVHGYPASKGEGWVGDGRTWELDVGALSSRLYFYQDPGTPPAIRKWPSIDLGTEIYISGQPETAEWVVTDFNVLVPSTT